MKLLAIYNIFDGLELLKGSIEQIHPFCDVLIVAQETSNWGEVDNTVLPYCDHLVELGLVREVLEYAPGKVGTWKAAQQFETAKRQAGIDWARENGYTHFILMDADEYYEPAGFTQMVEKGKLYGGQYHQLITYYKRPEWRFAQLEKYYVPGIHRLNNLTRTGSHHYPVRVDPTRAINEKNVLASEVKMHHFSYVRLDIEKKLRNSTARNNINTGNVLKAYENAKPGGKVSHVDAGELIEVMDNFGINGKIEEYKNFTESYIRYKVRA